MAAEKTLPSFIELAKSWVFDNFGVAATIAIAMVAMTSWIWWNWDTIKTQPGIAWVLKSVSAAQIDATDPNRFTVFVARLENDEDETQRELILRLLRDFEGIQALPVDRTVSVKTSDLEEQEREGHRIAREILGRRDASLVIWGRILRLDGATTRPDLSITGSGGQTNRSDEYQIETDLEFDLPAISWKDLSQVLSLAVLTQFSAIQEDNGKFVADRFKPMIDHIRKLINSSAEQEGWDAAALAGTRMLLGNSLLIFGDQSGEDQAINEAIAAYRDALTERTRDHAPLQWAATQNNLGNALTSLGDRESGTQRLEEAVDAYRHAIKERTRDRAPLQWAATHHSLGIALQMLGERESNTQRLDEAVDAYRDALKERTRDRAPMQWAATQSYLGTVLQTLGERENGTQRLVEAVGAHRNALKEFTRDHMPLGWAMIQNDLGNALQSLGERESGTQRLEEAVGAFRDSLLERTRHRAPLDWAMTQYNLGNALQIIGERESGIQRLEEAVGAYHDALKEYTRDRMPLDWAKTQINLEVALQMLGERESGTQRLEDAVDAFKGALEVFNNSDADYYVDLTTRNLLRARTLLEKRRPSQSPPAK